MTYLDILFIGIGLSLDAFAVSTSNGLVGKPKVRGAIAIALAFGVAQGVMPLIGYFFGSLFADFLSKWTHWIALALLTFFGVKMIWEACSRKEKEVDDASKLTFGVILIQAIATSIDALSVGLSLVGMPLNIYISVSIIACTTFLLSLIGVFIGKKFGNLFNKKAEIAGGIILIAIGIKIFVEAMFF